MSNVKIYHHQQSPCTIPYPGAETSNTRRTPATKIGEEHSKYNRQFDIAYALISRFDWHFQLQLLDEIFWSWICAFCANAKLEAVRIKLKKKMMTKIPRNSRNSSAQPHVISAISIFYRHAFSVFSWIIGCDTLFVKSELWASARELSVMSVVAGEEEEEDMPQQTWIPGFFVLAHHYDIVDVLSSPFVCQPRLWAAAR